MRVDIAIIGAGLVGMSLAAGLRGAGLRVAVVDPGLPSAHADQQWDTRIYAISRGSRRFLESCGAWTRIPTERIEHVETMQVYGDAGGAALFFTAYEAGLAELCYIVESRAIQAALADAVANVDDLSVWFGADPAALEIAESDVRIELSDGRAIEARLVVGADGGDSWLRTASGINTEVRDYHQIGVVANFETELGHGRVARQWFRPDGVLALLPLPGNRVSMVWSTWDAAADRLLAIDAGQLAEEVRQASHSALGMLKSMSQARGFALRKLHVSELVRPRLALIGDAAHCVHPLAGQGVNLGLQDARALADVLKTRGPQDDCGDYRLLRRYARMRKEPVVLMQRTTDALQRLFNNERPGMRWLRNTGLELTNGIAPLKRLLVEHALG